MSLGIALSIVLAISAFVLYLGVRSVINMVADGSYVAASIIGASIIFFCYITIPSLPQIFDTIIKTIG